MPANRIPLFKAMLRFGGSKDVPKSVEGSIFPDTALEKGVGYEFRTPDEEEEDDGAETDFYSTATRKSKLRKLARNKQYGSSSNSR